MTSQDLQASNVALSGGVGGELQRTQASLKIALLTIDKLKVELDDLRRMKYGSSSEQLAHAQLEGDRLLREQLDGLGALRQRRAHRGREQCGRARPESRGHRAFLRLGSDAGGNSATVIYTLIGTAKLNGINTQHYLRYVLERIAEHPSTASTSCCPGR